MRVRALLLAAALALTVPAVSAGPQPDEILEDAALETRARVLSRDLRCVVCRNESIDESNADLARDMRLLVRERLVEGDSDEEVLAYLVDRYGEFVLLRPTASGANLVLWISAPLMLLLALGTALVYLRQRERTIEPTATKLSPEEESRLRELMRD